MSSHHPPNQILNPYDLKHHSESSVNLLLTNKSINFNMTNMPPPFSCIIMNTQLSIIQVWLFPSPPQPPLLAWGTATPVKALEQSRKGTYIDSSQNEQESQERKQGKYYFALFVLESLTEAGMRGV